MKSSPLTPFILPMKKLNIFRLVFLAFLFTFSIPSYADPLKDTDPISKVKKGSRFILLQDLKLPSSSEWLFFSEASQMTLAEYQKVASRKDQSTYCNLKVKHEQKDWEIRASQLKDLVFSKVSAAVGDNVRFEFESQEGGLIHSVSCFKIGKLASITVGEMKEALKGYFLFIDAETVRPEKIAARDSLTKLPPGTRLVVRKNFGPLPNVVFSQGRLVEQGQRELSCLISGGSMKEFKVGDTTVFLDYPKVFGDSHMGVHLASLSSLFCTTYGKAPLEITVEQLIQSLGEYLEVVLPSDYIEDPSDLFHAPPGSGDKLEFVPPRSRAARPVDTKSALSKLPRGSVLVITTKLDLLAGDNQIRLSGGEIVNGSKETADPEGVSCSLWSKTTDHEEDFAIQISKDIAAKCGDSCVRILESKGPVAFLGIDGNAESDGTVRRGAMLVLDDSEYFNRLTCYRMDGKEVTIEAAQKALGPYLTIKWPERRVRIVTEKHEYNIPVGRIDSIASMPVASAPPAPSEEVPTQESVAQGAISDFGPNSYPRLSPSLSAPSREEAAPAPPAYEETLANQVSQLPSPPIKQLQNSKSVPSAPSQKLVIEEHF